MATIKYIFWDSDNTLVNTATHHWRKHFETLKSLGIALEDKWQERIYTNNGGQNWEWLSAELGLTLDKHDYLDRIDHWYYRHIEEIGVRAGIMEAIDIALKKKCRQAVVSNGRRRSVMAALNAKDLAQYFDFILCKEDYEGRKPGPEPYLSAKTIMQQLTGTSIEASECLVIEDDPKGVESGLAAGMTVIHRALGEDRTDEFLKELKTHLG